MQPIYTSSFPGLYAFLYLFVTLTFQFSFVFFSCGSTLNNAILHACMHALVYWCVAVTVVFQASLPLPVNSVKNSRKEDKGSVVESRKWRSYNAGDGV